MHSLVIQHQKTLLSFFTRRCHSRWDAEELTQEVFCKILKRQDVPYSDYTEPYIFSIAWSVLRDRCRHERVRQRDMHEVYDEDLAQEDPLSPEMVLNADELYERFLKALNRLTPRAKEIFFLSYYNDLSYPKIAANCNISVSAVQKHIANTLNKLKAVIDE